ncbi:MAG: chemotaxis protein CheA [Planctomycetaceae bacterium]|nr:chemotaxis protein CheA [Planctomycetaceae bacterium]
MDAKTLRKKLQNLPDLIAAVRCDEPDSLIRAGTLIEETIALLPQDPPALVEAMTAALEALQALFQNRPADESPVVQALGAAVNGVINVLRHPGNTESLGACNMATSVLHRVTAAMPSAAASAASQEPHDACPWANLQVLEARLIALTSDDGAELVAIWRSLVQEARSDAYCQRVKDLIGQAAELLGADMTDFDAAVAKVQRTLKSAIENCEHPSADSPPSPKAAVAAPAPAEPSARPAAGGTQGPSLPADADLELLGEYVQECHDHFTAAETALLTLETNPGENEELNRVFRCFHTIKGTSGLLGLPHIQGLAHLAENMLDRARGGQIRLTGGYADLALRSCDMLKSMVVALNGAQPGQKLTVPDGYDALCGDLQNPEAAGYSEETVRSTMRLGDILVGQGKIARDDVEQAAAQHERPIGQELVVSGKAPITDVAGALRTQKQMAGLSVEQSVRINTTRLDSLVDMVGELVIAQSMVSQDPDVNSGRMARLARSVSHAGKIVRELQDLTMSLRLVPLKSTFQKMTRLVRDLAHKSGKTVQLVTEGEETEIDRNMVETLSDPLVHMIRNSVDHGIEPADIRTAAGKNPTGTVTLRAYHAAGNVVIELVDDGKGLDRQRILAKASQAGLVDSSRELSDGEVFDLIFHPGLSTADKITDVSGRGVGMDVVKRGVESIRGRIEVASQPGKGTTFTLRLPLTMAIVDAMLLRVGQQRFLIPTVSIEHSFQPRSEGLKTVGGQAGEMVLLRDKLLPLFRLHRLFNVPGAVTDPTAALAIVIEAHGRRCALLADELLGQQQVVIKPLGESLQNIAGVSGGAILGDGRVGIILDASGIWSLATTVKTQATAA